MSIFKYLLVSTLPVALYYTTSQALAVDISCKAPKSILEKTICHSPKISKMNTELAVLYKPYARSILFQEIQKRWLQTLDSSFNNNDYIDVHIKTKEQKKLQEQVLTDVYQKQIDFYKALNAPPTPPAKIIVPTSQKKYEEDYSGDWQIYTLGTIPRYADQDKDSEHRGILDNTILAATFIQPKLYAVIYVNEKYDAKQAIIDHKPTLLSWTSSLYRYNSSNRKALQPFEEYKRILFMNNSYFYNLRPDTPPSERFYNPGAKQDGFQQHTYFYQYFNEKNKLIGRKYSFLSQKTQNTTHSVTNQPEHIQKYNNISVMVVYSPQSALNNYYDGNQLKIKYQTIPSNNLKSGTKATEQIYTKYAPPGYEDSRFLSTAWSKNYPFLYVNIEYSHPNKFGFSNILKIDINKKTIEQILPSDGPVIYHPYPISLGKVEAVLYLDQSKLKIAINMNSVPHNQKQEIVSDFKE